MHPREDETEKKIQDVVEPTLYESVRADVIIRKIKVSLDFAA